MKKLTADIFTQLVAASTAKPRLRRELRFTTSVEHIRDEQWKDLELIAITDRSGNTGVIIIEIDEQTYVLPCEFKRGLSSSISGRAQPITCDFCVTWQSGVRAGSVLFTNAKGSSVSIGYLCCGDLQCSSHVRGLTNAAKVSRAQLREDMTPEDRIERLKNNLRKVITNLQVEPITLQ